MTEENNKKSEVYRFGDCVLDADRRELTMAGKPVTTQPKAFELLLYLVRNRSRAVDKDELQDALWPRSIVTETALTRCVMKARRAVGDDADRQAIIKTVHGHGYRFVAAVRDEAETPAPTPTPTPTPTPAEAVETTAETQAVRRTPLLVIAAGIVIAALAGWWILTPTAVSGEVRLAVLPAENSTGDAELDWIRTGMMSLMNRMLEAKGVAVVSERSVIDLAGDRAIDELTRPDGEFDNALRQTTGHTHTLATKFEFEQGLYRLNYTLAGGDIRAQRRTIVGKEPTRLVKDAIDTIASLIQTGPPPDDRMRTISEDDFLNEAYARAMSLEFEGNYEDAKRFFEVIIEQDPELFWPRYEYALCVRNLRDFDNAERLLTSLVNEQKAAGNKTLEAISTNGLGILFMNQRRNDEALDAFDTVIRLASETDNKQYRVTGHVNLALLTRNMGDINTALGHMQTAHEVLQSQDLNAYPGTFHNTYAGILMRTGALEEAEQQALAAIESFELTGRRLYAAYSKSRLSTIYRAAGRYEEALELAEESLAVRREFNDQRGISSSLSSLADINVELGNLTRARQYAEQVHDIGVETDDDEVKAAALYEIAVTERLLGDARAAAAKYAEAEALRSSMGDVIGVDNARIGIARSWIDMEDFGGAEGIGQELVQTARDRESDRLEARALILLGEVDLGRENWRDAILHYDEALDIALRIGDKPMVFSIRASLARAWLEIGNVDAAQPLLDAVVLERPAHTEVNKLQARMAWERGDAAAAAEFMALARNSAGERWRDEDAAALEQYRAALP